MPAQIEQHVIAVRFDKWLWAARFYKTRGLAAQAVDAGQARLSGKTVKPAHPVRAGDAVTMRKQGLVWNIDVQEVTDRRGAAPEAARLYRERDASRVAREEAIALRRAAQASQPQFAGRPTKRQRRKLEDFLNEP